MAPSVSIKVLSTVTFAVALIPLPITLAKLTVKVPVLVQSVGLLFKIAGRFPVLKIPELSIVTSAVASLLPPFKGKV